MTDAIALTAFPAFSELANKLALSQIIPAALRKHPEDVLIILLTGHEMGFPPMASLKNINLINGRLCIAAEMYVGMIQANPACEYFKCTETTATKATWTSKKKGQPPVSHTFTIEMAATAGLIGKDNWRHYPDALLRARSSTALAKMEWAFLTSGFPMTAEEAQDLPPPEDQKTAMVTHAEDFASRVKIEAPSAVPAPVVQALPLPIITDVSFEAVPAKVEVASQHSFEAPVAALTPAPVDPLTTWKARISACDTPDKLRGVLADLKALPEEIAKPLRPIYSAQVQKVSVKS